MNRNRRKMVIISIGILLLLFAGYVGFKVNEHTQLQRQLEVERMEQERISMAYYRLNYTFGRSSDLPKEWQLEMIGMYLPFSGISKYSGINWVTYSRLLFFERETGMNLSFEEVIDYFSEEFEPDGSLRLYNNGKHPQIEAFVNWMYGRREEANEFLERMRVMYTIYANNHREEGFEVRSFSDISPQMMDALARKDADPEYELDLTSLQQQGY